MISRSRTLRTQMSSSNSPELEDPFEVDQQVGTGLPLVSQPLYSTGRYYVAAMINQRIWENGSVWNYGIVNDMTGITETYASTLPSAIIAADTLADKLHELLFKAEETKPEQRSVN